MLHLALSHFIVKLEEKYITPEFIDGAGERLCPHCGQLQPPNKLSFIRHIAMEHEDIIEVFAADKMFGNKWKILFKICKCHDDLLAILRVFTWKFTYNTVNECFLCNIYYMIAGFQRLTKQIGNVFQKV